MRIAGSNAKQDILEAATTLFKEQGVKNITINAICQQAKCSAGTFYYHFGSMKGLIAQMDEKDRAINAQILGEALSMPNAWEKLWRIHRVYVEIALSFGYQLYMDKLTCGGEYATLKSEIDQSDIRHIVTPIIREGQACGVIRNQTNAEALSDTIGIAMTGVFLFWYRSEGKIDLAQKMREELMNIYDVREDLRS